MSQTNLLILFPWTVDLIFTITIKGYNTFPAVQGNKLGDILDFSTFFLIPQSVGFFLQKIFRIQPLLITSIVSSSHQQSILNKVSRITMDQFGVFLCSKPFIQTWRAEDTFYIVVKEKWQNGKDRIYKH